ncbi:MULTISPECIES: sulfurtransferase [unclassified Rhodococcus (in: high G+C Gram-positive bacteria)]|uniref:sulfurtransferase n=1 Tax=unclassified Rhodococcus (in: high G+C Gram-positive bacteria) TaxID=192944 RepID=UPI002955A706|nr:sulfurtransferase [Rhodococcus sp. IEGM 1343]MDV8055696.1 sulfurtransferase [Rhodococcus sp. IEGM 1343]
MSPSPLISAAELHDLFEMGRAPVVLDVRWALQTGSDRAGYGSGHIPNAQFVDLDAELAGVPGSGGRHPLPDEETFVAAMRSAGVSDDSSVVVYDAGPATAAARAWWLLRYYGHADVRVLDGGLAQWVAEGFATGTEPSIVAAGSFSARPSLARVLDVGDVLEFAQSNVLLDARAPERFRGEVEPVDPVAGHIPGAINRPTTDNVDSDGKFLDPGVLNGTFGGLVPEGKAVAVYCGSGVTAAHQILALELAGFDAALYPGSWSGWITDPTRPRA